MKRFKNILVVYNEAIGADDALTQAAALAHANRARLTLIDVFARRRSSDAALLERTKCLSRTIHALKLDGIERVAAHLLTGTDSVEITRQVLKAKHDLVIASAATGNSVWNAIHGNMAIHLMRKCPCPVWIVKPGQTLPYARILAAVDSDRSHQSRGPLNAKIMDLATSLATTHDAELHVLHAWEVEGKDRHTLNSEIRDWTRKSLLKKHERTHRAEIDALLKRYCLSRIRHFVHLPEGLAIREIPNAVKIHGIDLIVMGTACRSGVSGLLIGNSAEWISTGVQCGVLSVKPEGFRSPIRPAEESAFA